MSFRWSISAVLLLLFLQIAGVSASLRSSPWMTVTPSLEGSRSLFVVHRDLRGGSTAVVDEDNAEQEDEQEQDASTDASDITQDPEFASLQSYRMQQQLLLQLRGTYLSEAIALRGLPLPTLLQVRTPEGARPPQPVDWDCAVSTEEDPKSCLYSFDAEPNTKVVAPLDTTQWITLTALNRLRRTDPTKVEPMWHSQFAILDSWFDPESPYSLLQHVGIQGFLLNALLQGVRLPIALGVALVIAAIIAMPVLEYVVNRLLVSGVLWSRWHQWSRFVHAALPLKLFLGQMAGKFVAGQFDQLLGVVKNRLVELECRILEERIPLTAGVSSSMSAEFEVEEDDMEGIDLDSSSSSADEVEGSDEDEY